MKEDVFEKLFGALTFFGDAKPASVVLLGGGPGEGKSHALLEMASRLPDGIKLIFVSQGAPTT